MTEPIDHNRRYESMLKSNPSNVEGIHYLAIWHLERQSYQQVCIVEDKKINTRNQYDNLY